MKVINLAYLQESEIKYKISRFPDGQQQVDIEIPKDGIYLADITIKSRMNGWKDLELIACTVASLRRLGVKEIHLYAPYILGARSDRKFVQGGNSYLTDVVGPFIDSLDFNTVTCIDVHSDVADAAIGNLSVLSNTELVQFALTDIGYYEESMGDKLSENFVLVSPDAGAMKKIHKLADAIGYKNNILVCSKSRDTEGHLSKIVVPEDEVDEAIDNEKDFIIIDDICDGGRTFINIAHEIKEHYVDAKIYLIVTHGIFSAKTKQGIPIPFNELTKYFEGIYCTNSVQDIYDVWNDGYKNRPTHVKQLKVI